MVTYTLHFEVGPDAVASGGAGHYTEIFVVLNEVSFGNYLGGPESGNDGVRDWTAHSVDVSTSFNPAVENHLRWGYTSTGVRGGKDIRDTCYVRRVRVEGSNSTIYYGEFPQGFPYSSDLQDGPQGAPNGHIMTDGDFNATQYSAETDAFVTSPDHQAHLYFSIAAQSGWHVGSIAFE